MSWTADDARDWVTYGTDLLMEHIAGLTEETASRPSTLPTWSRKHLVAHLSGNADALGNLVQWAATGERTPMYSSPEQRQADIDSGAEMTIGALLAWFRRSAADLAKSMDQLTPAQWETEVVTAQGRTVPATTIPWLRAREVTVHAVDLGTGITFADLPMAFLRALCDDIVIKRNTPAVTLEPRQALRIHAVDVDAQFDIRGEGDALSVQGDLPAVTAFLAGRAYDGKLAGIDGASIPNLPPWL